MGVDCKLRIDNRYIQLDRWFVFSPCIKSSVLMTKSDALSKIRELKKTKKLKVDTKVWKERQEEFIKYRINWLVKARRLIKQACKNAKIVFYSDNDVPDEYYEKYYK